MSARDRQHGDEPKRPLDHGVTLRPEAVVLGDDALLPDTNIIRPPPNRFTHELIYDEAYRLDRPAQSGEPDGMLRAGTPVVLLVEALECCRVVDASGLYVEVRRTSLRRLPGA